MKDGEVAYLSEERDIEGIAGNLERILLNPDEAKGLSIKACEYVRQRHSIHEMARALEAIYDKCMP